MNKIIEISNKIDSLLEKKGVSKYSHYVERREKREFNLDGDEFSLFRTTFDYNASVTEFLGTKQGSASGNDISEEGLTALIDSAYLSAESAEEDPAKDIAPGQGTEEFLEGVLEPDMDKLFKRVEEFRDTLNEKYPKIKLFSIVASYSRADSVYRNANKTEFREKSGYYVFSATFAGNDGTKTTGMNGAYGIFKDLNTPFIEIPYIKDEIETSVAQLTEVSLPDKFEGVLVLKPGCALDFVGSIIGNYISGTVILDGTSQWKDKLNEKVVDERVNIVSDPFDERLVVSKKYTNDGFKAEKVPFVEKGVLKNFLLNLYIANKIGSKPTMCDSPALVIEPGTRSVNDIIKSVKKGLLVGSFSGGQPGANGEFSGVAKNSFLIENGEVKGAVSETMISGNLVGCLNKLVDISKETEAAGYAVLPYMAVDGITISGK